MGLYIGSSNVAGGGSVTDSSVAAFIGAGGPTDTALSATYAARGRKSIAIYDDFTSHANGALNDVQSLVGGTWNVTGAQGVSVTSGKAASSGTGYMWQALTGPVGGAFCEVSFTGPTINRPMTMGFTSGSTIDLNNLATHFNFGAKDFNVTVRKDSGSFDVILAGKWRKDAVSDGTTVHRVGIQVSRNTVVVTGPHGEMFATTDARVSALMGSVVFWEPNTTTGTSALLASVGAFTRAATGQPGQADLLDWQAGAGTLINIDGQVVGNRNTVYEVNAGVNAADGNPAIVFGATTIYTVLTSAATVGATSIVTEQALPKNAVLVIESGNNTEGATTSAVPTPLTYNAGPYTSTLTGALTKAHAVGASVVATIPSAQRGIIEFNPYSNGYMTLTPGGGVLISGSSNLYLGTSLDTFIKRAAAGVVSVGKLAVGNAAAATTPGTVVKKIEVFDAGGTSLGFVPVYSAIT